MPFPLLFLSPRTFFLRLVISLSLVSRPSASRSSATKGEPSSPPPPQIYIDTGVEADLLSCYPLVSNLEWVFAGDRAVEIPRTAGSRHYLENLAILSLFQPLLL